MSSTSFFNAGTDRTNAGLLRAIPDTDHKWVMGLRRSDAGAFFAPRDDAGAVRAERARWLAEAPYSYAALTPAAEPALHDTIALANANGVSIDASLSPWDQLLALGRAWECDFVWMHDDGAGAHRVTGGVVCFPSSWSLQDKMGKTMSETHAPVPGLNDVMGPQIETFFARMVPGEAWVRENANYSRVADLNQHPGQPIPPLDATVTAGEFWIRLEHQLLLKLPASRSILFAIRVEMLSLQEVMADADASARLANWLETMSDDAARYKSVDEARDVIVRLLRAAQPEKYA
jgi:hypothetical protein